MTKKLSNRIIKLIWISFFLMIACAVTSILMVRYDTFGWFGGLPSLEELERPNPDLSSELISADGVVLGKYFRKNRTPVRYHELSAELINTLLVTEDIRFKNHSGIDLKGLFRAALSFGQLGGGSTLTMQLAENLYKTSTENKGSLYKIKLLGYIITKIKEWIISVQLEKSYTKEEILAMYLNTIEFGSNSYGIKVAAKTFFNKLPSQLNYQESAILIGALNAPTAYSPVLNPDRSLNKRKEILYNVFKYNLISQSEFDSLKNLPLQLNYRVNNQNVGPAPYFRKVVGNFLYHWCKQNQLDLYEDGLKIYTTIDSRLQTYAEEAVAKNMKNLQGIFDQHILGKIPWIDNYGYPIEDYLENAIKKTPVFNALKRKYNDQNDSIEFYLNQPKTMKVFSWNKGMVDTLMSSYDSLSYYKKFLHTGFMAMEPKSGHIKAWVGGINHQIFKYDHVKQGKRQPGSTFKPFVYTAAIDHGYYPCYQAVDVVRTYEIPNQPPWSPGNATGVTTNQKMTLRQAMARSINTITAFIGSKLTPESIVKYAQKMGISSKLNAVPSLVLGAGGDVSLFEMVGAYATFVNKGVYTTPFYIAKIEDKHGNVIKAFPTEQTEAINETTAYVMLHMLKGTTEEVGGTARGLDPSLIYNHDIGAKTGTTNNASDGWFIGFTKDLAAGVWVGGDERSIHFRNWLLGQGSRTAMPIWEDFMLKVYNDSTLSYKGGTFDKPIKPLNIELDCSKFTQENDSLFQEVKKDDIY